MMAVSGLIYTILTPVVFVLALRYPIEKKNSLYRVPLYVLGGIGFVAAHVVLRIATIHWFPVADQWKIPGAGILGSLMHWFAQMFLYMCTDDLFSTYLPVIALSLGVNYYRKLKIRETTMSAIEAQLARSELRAIKMQLQPHFLFNTLHSISALMHVDVEAADQMMSRLSDLLRTSLQNSSIQWTSLNRELDFITGYLNIEQARFSDRLNVIWDIDPQVLGATVPHFLLQPLVENAIRHGISKKTSDGQIRLTAKRDDGHLLLAIADNGPGFPSCACPATGFGVGLRTTRERLRALYDDHQQFTVNEAVGGGTVVNIRLPFSTFAASEVLQGEAS
jgi:LytS/YehU family sensor histidine kinase